MRGSIAFGLCAFLSVSALFAIEPREEIGRFDHLVQAREGGVIGIRPATADFLPPDDTLRREWQRLTVGVGGHWRVWLDERSGLPTLAVLSGIRWRAAGEELDVDALAARAEAFLRNHPEVLGNWGSQVELDRDASRPRGEHVWQIRFRQVVDGIPVEGARYDFHVSHGNLVAFGAARWAPVRIETLPNLNADEARARLDAYVRPTAYDAITDLDAPELLLLPVDADGDRGAAWTSDRGTGFDHRLVWRFRFQDRDGMAIWTGEVDAHTGEIVAFYDDTRYADIQGHVNPISDDGLCDEDGCPEPDYPMPFVDYTENGGPVQYAGQHGGYTCSTAGSTIETTLDGQYFRINDNCGPISATTTCGDDLDLGASVDINCGAAPGESPGNTDASRSAYYSLNLVNRKARFWISGNAWLDNDGVVCNTNVNSTCNANWGNDTINMFRAGNGCGNTSQIQGVVVHEWGHGFDENDGGGFDDSSEAYADVVAIFEARDSCVGRGFRPAQACTGFGDACVSCTGIRDMDWMARRDQTPATPSGFLATYCPSGGGPCGKETHCESYVPAEAMYDLATRDLPAMGIDADSAWQFAERIWYQSRPGSGGDIFNCSLPASDSCGTNGWYHQLRLQDDDDGNLMNGTPHAAAIFAAFDRHDIACGTASDPENQNRSSCSPIDAPQLQFTAQTDAVLLDWDPVAGTDRYRLYRNENGCAYGQFPVAEVDSATTTYLDDGLSNGFPVYYRVQAVGVNPSCESPVSACIEAAAQATAGRVRLSRTAYGCSDEIAIEVTDANHPTAAITVTIRSDSEATPESVVLGETSVGSSRFSGSIFTTSAPAAADGLLSISDGDVIVVEYVDLDDGDGGANVLRQATATGDCVAPSVQDVRATDVTDFAANIRWTTNENASARIRIGDTVPPVREVTGPSGVTDHLVLVGGLDECTVYSYSVESADVAGNVVIDDDRGNYFRFESYIDLGSGPRPCHQGRIAIEVDEVSCASTVPITVSDVDLNLDPGLVETVVVAVTSSTETTPETLTLTETGPDTAKFAGSIETEEAAPSTGDGVVQVTTGDVVTATYHDDSDGEDRARTSFDSVTVDCDGAAYLSVAVQNITDNSAVIAWTTSKETTGEVHWGMTPTLGNVTTDFLTTSHAIEISPFSECGRVFFRVLSTDSLGTTTVADAAGSPFELNAGTSGGVVYRDDFESVAGWTLEGEWEIGAPQGLGSAPGDPIDAFSGTGVLGHDLGGLGAHPGNYEPESNEAAVGPVIDTSSLPGAELKFNRWLNVLTGTFAYLDVKNAAGSWINVWKSPTSGGFTESAWSAQSFDVSAHTAGNSSFQIRFRNTSHIASSTDAGWNVDQLILRDTSQPDYQSCGGCGGGPSFAGVISAIDVDPCGDSGVTLSWTAAPSWGTGATGTYAIYRDTLPGFTPSPANRVGSGISGTSWTDVTAPAGVAMYYVVRAENDETCGAGPNNGGVLDDNLVFAGATNANSQPAPGAVGNSLRLENVNDAHARLSWSPAPNAAGYRVYRTDAPGSTFVVAGTTTSTTFEDVGALGRSADGYYRVLAIDACGNEGP